MMFAREATKVTVPTVEVAYSGTETRTFRALGQLYKFGSDSSHRDPKRIPVDVATALVGQQPDVLKIVEGSYKDPNAPEVQTVADEPVAVGADNAPNEVLDNETSTESNLDVPPSPPEPVAVPAPEKKKRKRRAKSA